MSRHLSPKMHKALEMASTSAHQSLYRWPGGFWTGDPWPGLEKSVPHEHVGTATVEALIERGHFEVAERMKRGDPCKVYLL
jgi:hypothetical protein